MAHDHDLARARNCLLDHLGSPHMVPAACRRGASKPDMPTKRHHSRLSAIRHLPDVRYWSPRPKPPAESRTGMHRLWRGPPHLWPLPGRLTLRSATTYDRRGCGLFLLPTDEV